MNPEFITEFLLEKKDICNLSQEKKYLEESVLKGRRTVIYGLRNTGKTSVLKSHVIPFFHGKYPKGLVVFVDFLGVKTLEQIHALS